MSPPEGIWPRGGRTQTFREVLAQAIDDIAERGFESIERVEFWVHRLRAAAEQELSSEAAIETQMRDAMSAIYTRLIERGRIAQLVPGVSRFTIASVQPKLRAELDRRIIASANLVRLNRREAIETTLRRLQGWSTSIPPGGEGVIDKREVRQSIGKSVAQVRFEQRRVAIDQGHKLAANIGEIVAVGSGAIAGEWNSRWRQTGYNFREPHKEIDRDIFVVRDNWALKEGLIKLAGRKYIDDIERPSALPFCRCFYRWITSIRRLPEEMLTERGRAWLKEAASRRRAA